ncbi:hypothetical protein OG787_09090 [Streptomyces sp. NBC_00075]|uniref:hypothetical protein n=1 Tax=Streptomyces sp. NBC_00075 TaxID=2975641 RepID=UPI0032469859
MADPPAKSPELRKTPASSRAATATAIGFARSAAMRCVRASAPGVFCDTADSSVR